MSDEEHFAFGANWNRFLKLVNEERIAVAMESLRVMTGHRRWDGLRFLDAGCGSGLFSLAAHRLGAEVHSFDVDPLSVGCAQELRSRYGQTSPAWTIEAGSALDADYLARLGTYDIVYSWGVLHHTGAMWTAIDLVARTVAPEGLFWIAIYNDQGQASHRWKQVKRLYQRLPVPLRPLLVGMVAAGLMGRRFGAACMSACVRLLLLRNPLLPVSELWRDLHRRESRGMDRWIDLTDWVGGWPFEVAKPEEIFRHLRDRGFSLIDFTTCGGGLGCNEFLLRRIEGPRLDQAPPS